MRKVNNIILILAIVALIVLAFNTVVISHQGSPGAVEPFANRYLLGEKVTYLFRSPAIGDAIIFVPAKEKDSNIGFIGVIIDVANAGDITTYKVTSAPGRPWIITRDKIRERVYFPILPGR